MLKAFPIDFVRQILIQTLLEEHKKNPDLYFGNENQVSLLSFYEQLEKQDEVDRYVEIYRDLTNQQNRTGLIMNGTLLAPENPTITNLNQATIIPMTFTCAFRVKLANRDNALATCNHLIEILKGRKQDVAEFKNGKLFKVGTIANRVNGTPSVINGDFIGDFDTIATLLTNLYSKGFVVPTMASDIDWWNYCDNEDGELCVCFHDKDTHELHIIQDDGTHPEIVFPPVQDIYNRYSVSMSFDSVRCDEPRTLNSDEYCVISFGGSATLVNSNVLLGNELVKVGIKKLKIKAVSDISITDTIKWLEPLEIPSESSANKQIMQRMSSKFIQSTHTDSLAVSLQYSFVIDKSIPLIKQMWKYARYGVVADGTTITYVNGISPNMIFEITEIWSSWGDVDINVFKAKIVDRIENDNTESDVPSLTIPFQKQGDIN